MLNRTLLALCLLAPASAHAYSTSAPWAATTVDFYAPSSAWSDLLQSFSLMWAEAIVDDNPSPIQIDIGEDDDSTYVPGNFENEIAWTSSMASYCSSAPDGCALVYTSGGYIVEADVLIDSTTSLEYYAAREDGWAYGGSSRPMVPLLLHELGHALGLSHENAVYNVMGIEYSFLVSNGDDYTPYLGADASAGLRSLYGSDASSHDLTVSHWRYDSASGAYSRHRRTGLKTSAKTTPTSSTVDGETAYEFAAGSTVQVEATYENAGVSNKTATVRYYLSSDREITTSDTYLGYKSVSFTASGPTTSSTSVTLPSTLSTGTTWFIGAVVDPSNTVSETNEDNNAAYLAQVKIALASGTGGSTTTY